MSTTTIATHVATEEFITSEQWSLLRRAYKCDTPINGQRILTWEWTHLVAKGEEWVKLSIVPGELLVARVDDSRARTLADQQVRMPIHQLLAQLLRTPTPRNA